VSDGWFTITLCNPRSLGCVAVKGLAGNFLRTGGNDRSGNCRGLAWIGAPLSGSSAEGDELRSHGNALGDFHTNHRFERFQFARV